jgi:TIR domain
VANSIFLSHNKADKEFVGKIYEDLTSYAIRVWLDEAEIEPGDSLIGKIEEAIDTMDYLGIMLSPNSVSSSWVREEVRMAMHEQIRGKKIKVIPISIKNCELPGFLREKRYIDFRDSTAQSYQEGMRQLISKLKGKRYVIPRSDRQKIIDSLESVPEDAKVFRKDFSKERVLSLLKALSDVQFDVIYNLVKYWQHYQGSRGIVKSLAIKTIGGEDYEARQIFDTLVQFDFLSLSNDPSERNDPDPRYDYTDLFYRIKILFQDIES